MARMRFDPFRDVQLFQSRMNRVFDEVFGRARPGPEGEEGTGALFTPPVDLWEAPEAYFVRVELPGVMREDVKLEVSDSTLVVSGERKLAGSPTGGQWLRQEGSYGPFYRAIQLPAAVDAERIQARVQHGVLEVIIPKAEEAKAKRITITT